MCGGASGTCTRKPKKLENEEFHSFQNTPMHIAATFKIFFLSLQFSLSFLLFPFYFLFCFLFYFRISFSIPFLPICIQHPLPYNTPVNQSL